MNTKSRGVNSNSGSYKVVILESWGVYNYTCNRYAQLINHLKEITCQPNEMTNINTKASVDL